jgi:1-acyl-sn-glycerol-3-phosphate acyltransferase
MGESVKTKPSPFWLAYFIFSIAFLGSFFAYASSIPFFLLGRIFPSAQKIGGRALAAGTRVLLRVQPWLKGEIDIRPLNDGCLLVSNHRSHLDAFLVLSAVPGVRILAKEALFHVPFLGMMMRVSGQVPARKNDPESYLKAMEQIGRLLSAGERVHVFPEGTRCPPGLPGTQAFSLAPFHVAYQRKIPIVPLVISGTDEAWGRDQLGIRYGQPISVRTLKPVLPENFPSAEALRSAVVAQINLALYETRQATPC